MRLTPGLNDSGGPTSFFDDVREASVLQDQLAWLVHGIEYLVVAIDIASCVILLIVSDVIQAVLNLAMADLIFLDRELGQVRREKAE